jgi:glycosyltransferase involved in cell wall biosynthesis
MQKFSIILPVRNGGLYVKDCVQSILSQSVTDFDLQVLDNSSTDGTLEWLQSLGDPRIRIYPSPGPLSIEENWGRILSIPKNEFMTMIGHDDLLHPLYLQEMNGLISAYPEASLYQSHFRYIDQHGGFVRHCLPMDRIQYAHEFLACQFSRTMDSMGSGYMMRSAHYDRLGGMPTGYPNLIFADYELWVNLIRLSYKATALRECFSYRLHANLSRTTNGMLYQSAFGKYMEFIKMLIPADDSIREVVERYGKDMLYYFCEALSHRLLKTPVRLRQVSVSEFIKKCKCYAEEIIPGQDFQPLQKFRIRIADRLDRSFMSRNIFYLYKKLIR